MRRTECEMEQVEYKNVDHAECREDGQDGWSARGAARCTDVRIPRDPREVHGGCKVAEPAPACRTPVHHDSPASAGGMPIRGVETG